MDSKMTAASRKDFIQGTSSSSQSPASTRAQRRGSRTTNACEACKKRKTKCSGPPSVCEACQKVDTFCHFNLRLDTRRKLAYKPRIVRERQQYILEGILQILKHNDSSAVQEFVKLIRSEARPQEIAHCLKHNLHHLQGRGLIPALEVDETDLVSLGLQSLFSHRAGRSGMKTVDNTTSPTTSDRNEAYGSLTRISHGDTANSLHQRDSTTTISESFTTSFGHVNRDGSFEMEEQFHSRLDGDSPSECSEDIAYNQDFVKTLSPTTPHMASTFGNFAGGILASNVRPLFLQTGLQQPGYWRTDSPTSLQQNTLSHHTLSTNTDLAPNPRVHDERPAVGHASVNPKQSLQVPFGPGMQTDQLVDQSKIDSELLYQQRMAQNHWNMPNWACEATTTAT